MCCNRFQLPSESIFLYSILSRTFQGSSDETAFVQQAVLFGELIQSNKETGVDFNTYFSVEYYNGDPGSVEIEEIWFKKENSFLV